MFSTVGICEVRGANRQQFVLDSGGIVSLFQLPSLQLFTHKYTHTRSTRCLFYTHLKVEQTPNPFPVAEGKKKVRKKDEVVFMLLPNRFCLNVPRLGGADGPC